MIEPVPVHVWWADLTQADLALAGALPAAERERVMATQRPADRGRRLVAAALLQHAVAASRRAGPPVGGPGEVGGPVEVDRTCQECGAQHGRPVASGGPHLSVAHAGVLVVVATCARAMVGVDVERVDRFAGSEEEAVAWTRSEAAVKAGIVDGRGGTATTLRTPLPGYVATVRLAHLAGVAVAEHRVTLPRPRPRVDLEHGGAQA